MKFERTETVVGMRVRHVPAKEDPPLERTITDGILRWLRSQDKCWCFKVAGSGGQMRGVPDIVGCYHGWFFALEVKRPKLGKLSAIQHHVIEQIAGAGGFVAVVRSLDDVKALFAMMGDKS